MTDTNRAKKSAIRPRVYTSRGAAVQLGVTGRTVQNWVADGVIPAIRTAGGHIRISQESLEVFQAARLAQSQSITPRKLSKSQTQQVRILIAEDNAALAALYDSILKQRHPNAEVRIVANGFESLLEIGHFSPNILVTDIDMPEMDGIQMLRALYNTNIDLPKVTVVITGLDKKEIKKRGGLPSNVKLMFKPLQASKLLKFVDKVFSN